MLVGRVMVFAPYSPKIFLLSLKILLLLFVCTCPAGFCRLGAAARVAV